MAGRLLLAATLLCVAATAAAADGGKGFKLGESVKLQCKDWTTGEWGPGPICKETGKELGFSFGMDNFLYCGLEIPDKAAYDQLKDIVALNKAWHCRVPLGPDAAHHVPFVLPLWGVVEGDHLHMDNHVNFVLHADAGKIIAAAAYPVRDRFQLVVSGVVVSLHGPVRWFDKASFVALGGARGGAAGDTAQRSGEPAPAPEGCTPQMALAWCVASAALSLSGAAMLYQRLLKPSIVRRCLKAR